MMEAAEVVVSRVGLLTVGAPVLTVSVEVVVAVFVTVEILKTVLAAADVTVMITVVAGEMWASMDRHVVTVVVVFSFTVIVRVLFATVTVDMFNALVTSI